MSNTTTFQVTVGNLPENYQFTPQDFADKLGQLLQIRFAEDVAIFKRGATEPTNTNDAWLEDGRRWKYFDQDVGAWLDIEIDDRYKRIYVRAADPFMGLNADSPVERALWLRTNEGTATGVEEILIYLDGSWRTILNTEGLSDILARVNSVIRLEGGLLDEVVGEDQLEDGLIEAIRKRVLNSAHPIGSIYENEASEDNPAVLMEWPESTWAASGQGRVLIGAGASSGLTTRTRGDTGGAEAVTLTGDQSGTSAHTHAVLTRGHDVRDHRKADNGGLGVSLSHAGGGATVSYELQASGGQNLIQENTGQAATEAHENMPPFLVVMRWVRTA